MLLSHKIARIYCCPNKLAGLSLWRLYTKGKKNSTNFCVFLFLQAWSGHQMTCEGTTIVWQWRDRSTSRFPNNSNLLWNQKYSYHIANRKFHSHNMASVPVYCLCRLPYDVTRFMIECDICQDWFHGRWVFYTMVKASVLICVLNCYCQLS